MHLSAIAAVFALLVLPCSASPTLSSLREVERHTTLLRRSAEGNLGAIASSSALSAAAPQAGEGALRGEEASSGVKDLLEKARAAMVALETAKAEVKDRTNMLNFCRDRVEMLTEPYEKNLGEVAKASSSGAVGMLSTSLAALERAWYGAERTLPQQQQEQRFAEEEPSGSGSAESESASESESESEPGESQPAESESQSESQPEPESESQSSESESASGTAAEERPVGPPLPPNAGGSESDSSSAPSSSAPSPSSAPSSDSTPAEKHGDLAEADVKELRSQTSSMRAEAAESKTRFQQEIKVTQAKVDADGKEAVEKLEADLNAVVSDAAGKAPDKMKAFNGRLASMHAEISASVGGAVAGRETKRRAALKAEQERMEREGAAQLAESFNGCAPQ